MNRPKTPKVIIENIIAETIQIKTTDGKIINLKTNAPVQIQTEHKEQGEHKEHGEHQEHGKKETHDSKGHEEHKSGHEQHDAKKDKPVDPHDSHGDTGGHGHH
jgi:zinc transport system substrate-binding protein